MYLLTFLAGNPSLGFPSMSTEQEEVIINCLAIFYEDGKGGEIKFSEKRLAKLREIVW